MSFLASRDPRPLAGAPAGLTADGLFLGQGNQALEVAVYQAAAEPTRPILRELHEARAGQRAAPVVVVVEWGAGRAALATRMGDVVVPLTSVDRGQAERICEAALDMPDRHGALRFLAAVFGQLDPRNAGIPGVRNEGLFALHELATGVRRRPDWAPAAARAGRLLALRGRALVQQLGFGIQPLPGPASVLVAKGSKRGVAVFLDRPNEIDAASQHYDNVSPITYALAKADQESLKYVVVAAGGALRVYPVRPGVGTGRRGRTETFVELNLAVLGTDDAAYLWLLASADALAAGGTFEAVLARSTEYAVDLGERLRDRVYTDVIPPLANALVQAQQLRRPTAKRLAETYDMALLVLFRLLFVAYAEDKDLLPLHTNAQYREHSLKRIAQRLLDGGRKTAVYGREAFLWTEVQQLWRAVDRGNPAWGVPVYNGGLFAPTRADGGTAAAESLSALELADEAFAPALRALLTDVVGGGSGPVDFRSLGVREFGTIYEGLLESELSVARQPLAVAEDGTYVTADAGDEVAVPAGTIYLHNASGARKSSGSYYTKSFAVEHLLDRTLEPALDDHLACLDALDERRAGERFFDFRVADLAMGSAHFLVAAVDRIERRLSNYLARRDLPDVRDELTRLRTAADAALGDQWTGDRVEDTQLLRRQIARRCVYGVDRNATAVELARLSMWIHTFVPGLPLSFLDHNLVPGNGLVGIATFDEAREALGGDVPDLFAFTAEQRLRRVREPVERLGRLADATAAEVREAKALFAEARARVASEASLLTILTAARVNKDVRGAVGSRQVSALLDGEGDLFVERLVGRAERALEAFEPLHMPVTFPQVFLGERPGFDVILGNPPWDKVRFEEDAFYGRYIPGLIGMSQPRRKAAIQERLAVEPELGERADTERAQSQAAQEYFGKKAGAFAWQGAGHLDTAKLFTERSLRLLAPDGRLGYVLPRQCLVLDGWSDLRAQMFSGVSEVAQLRNRNGWVFEDAHHSYVIALLALHPRAGGPPRVEALPLADSLPAFDVVRRAGPVRWEVRDLCTSDAAAPEVPIFATADIDLLRRLGALPQIGRPSAGAYWAVPWAILDVGRDLQKIGLDPDGTYVLRTRNVEAFATTRDPDCRRVSPHGLATFVAGKVQKAGWAAALGLVGRRAVAADPDLLAITYRYPSRNDDSRTLIAALLPDDATPAVGYNHALVMPRAGGAERLYVLGMLNSLVWDWLARRFTDRHATTSVLQRMPLPVAVDPGPVADLTAALLAGDPHCRARLARMHRGPRPTGPRADLLVRLNVVAAQSLGLTRADMEVVLDDFSARAVPPDMRAAVLEAL